MSEPHGGVNLLVAAGDQSFGSMVADTLEDAEATVRAEYIDTPTGTLTQGVTDDIDGVVVDDTVAEPVTVVDRLTNQQNLPVVVLTDPTESGETIADAIEAGATDVFPRTTETAQYELVVERIASEAPDPPAPTDPARAERPYREVFENVSDGLVVHEPDTGEILDVNEQFCEMTGYSRAELVGETVGLVTADDWEHSYERAKQLIQRVRDDGRQLFEWREQHRDGHTYPVEVHLSLVELHGEERVLASVRDITERKRREQEYERIFNGVNDPIAVFDPHTSEITDVNEPYYDMVGYDDLETIRELGIEGLSASDEGYTGERGAELVREVNDTGESMAVEWEAMTAGGERRWLEVTLSPAVIRGEERVLSIQRDVTERKRREQEFEQIFNGVQDAIIVYDPDTMEAIDVNEAYLDMFGYENIEAVREQGLSGLSVTEAGYTEQRAREIHQRVAANGQPEILEWQGETRDGERIWMEVKVAPVVIGGDQRTVSIDRDITERKRREQRLEVFNRVLRHNLRNQLDVIRGHAEVLADQTADDHADQITDAVDELAVIGRRARKIDRIMSKEATPTEVEISELLREAVEAVRPTQSDVDVTTELSGTRLRANEETVTMAVEGALENAFEHAASAVTVATEDSPDGCVITIADDGPGIPEEELVPIEAGTERNLQHGRGLGLWQLRWSVDKLNGELSFETGAGTVVRITVPDRREPTHLD
jgi:PAS domain S-box-containing protein